MHIVDAVKQIRQMDPGIGYYKLWLMSKRMFLCDWVPGRDAFLQLLRDFQLTQRRPKPRHTTNSNHRYHRYKNLIRGFVPTRPNQLWVSDITYIDLVGDSCYLHLVTDAYSHKIVGWCLSDTLEAEYTLEALRMAISQATADELRGLVHHSDRGVQYCCNAYTVDVKRYGMRISMREVYNPTDNAIADRVNGILKTEVIYREKRFKTYQDALERISGFIAFYNETRPHSSIGMKTPSEAHQVAVIIAQIACYNGHLPQGAPSSPIITNLICQVLDMHLLKIAKKYKLDYTRYADDLTFSTNDRTFLIKQEQFIQEISSVISKAGFSVNEKKTRVQYKDSRQEVTGLIVNKKVNVNRTYVRETKAMAHQLYTSGQFTINGESASINQLEVDSHS